MLKQLHRGLSALDRVHRRQVLALTVVEMEELEHVFTLLLLGSFIGLPSPPSFLAVELLPFMERELTVLEKRARDSGDMLAEMCGTLGLD